MEQKTIYIDLLFVIERLLPGKGSLALFRDHDKYLPVSTLSLGYYNSASALQLALYRFCPNYAAFSQNEILADSYWIDGKEAQIQSATHIMSQFIAGAYWWTEHYINIFKDNWSETQKDNWLKDLRLLVQTIIGVGNCNKAAWIIENHTVIQALSYHKHLTPFLQHYD